MDNRETCGFAFDWSTHATLRFGRGGKYKRTKDSIATYIHCMQSAVCLALISSRTRTPVGSIWSVLAGTAWLLVPPHMKCTFVYTYALYGITRML